MTNKSATKKDEIFATAKEDFDVKLDRRLTLAQLEEQVKRVKNVITGNEFDYNVLFKDNPDLQIVEWETNDGDN